MLREEDYSLSDLSCLYRKRWLVELRLRYLKTILQMDVLRGQTPEMVRKEIWMTLLGYNVIRMVMAQASQEHRCDPRHLSFKGALQTVQEFGPALRAGSARYRRWLWTIVLSSVAGDAVGHRPNRVEPRARKRRPKPYPLLTKPRRQARAALLKTG